MKASQRERLLTTACTSALERPSLSKASRTLHHVMRNQACLRASPWQRPIGLSGPQQCQEEVLALRRDPRTQLSAQGCHAVALLRGSAHTQGSRRSGRHTFMALARLRVISTDSRTAAG